MLNPRIGDKYVHDQLCEERADQTPCPQANERAADDYLAAFRLLSETEGIIPALEPAHALAWLAREAGRSVPAGATVLVTLSGRGDKDVAQVREMLR